MYMYMHMYTGIGYILHVVYSLNSVCLWCVLGNSCCFVTSNLFVILKRVLVTCSSKKWFGGQPLCSKMQAQAPSAIRHYAMLAIECMCLGGREGSGYRPALVKQLSSFLSCISLVL